MGFGCRKKLPAKAAKLATSPPAIPVTIISKIKFPFKGNTEATFDASKLSFTLLFQNANPPHKTNREKKAQSQASHGFCGIKTATIKAAMAMLHQSKKRPKANANKAVRIIVIIGFININLRIC